MHHHLDNITLQTTMPMQLIYDDTHVRTIPVTAVEIE
jgi:hypothetical protein